MGSATRNLPNILTFIRLALIPIFVFLMLDPTTAMLQVAVGLFIVACLTDYIDGFLARKFGAESDFGKLLDPLADKILVMSALVMLVAQRADLDGAPWVPGWMVVLVLAREIWVTGLRAMAAARGNIVAASTSAKWKSGFQMLAVILLLMHYPFRLFGMEIPVQWLGLNLLFLSIMLSYYSAYEYSYAIFKEEGAE